MIHVPIGEEHYYRSRKDPNVWFPSVTTVLQCWPKGVAMEKWLGNHESYESAKKEKEDAGFRGTKVHKAIQRLITEDISLEYERDVVMNKEFTLQEWMMLDSFVNWCEDFRPRPLLDAECNHIIERSMTSENYKLGGTVDFVGMTHLVPGYGIIDFKTSSGIRESHILQTHGYFLCAFETFNIKAEWLSILRLGTRHKRGYEFKVFAPDQKYIDALIAIRDVWNFQNPDCKPKTVNVRERIQLTGEHSEAPEGYEYGVPEHKKIGRKSNEERARLKGKSANVNDPKTEVGEKEGGTVQAPPARKRGRPTKRIEQTKD